MARFKPHEFAGVIVESISVKKGRGGVTREFTEPLRGKDLVPDMVQTFIDKHTTDKFGNAIDHTLSYDLTVRAATTTGARMKARSFVRAKNPFEVGFTEVNVRGRDRGMEEQATGPHRYYRVTAEIVK